MAQQSNRIVEDWLHVKRFHAKEQTNRRPDDFRCRHLFLEPSMGVEHHVGGLHRRTGGPWFSRNELEFNRQSPGRGEVKSLPGIGAGPRWASSRDFFHRTGIFRGWFRSCPSLRAEKSNNIKARIFAVGPAALAARYLFSGGGGGGRNLYSNRAPGPRGCHAQKTSRRRARIQSGNQTKSNPAPPAGRGVVKSQPVSCAGPAVWRRTSLLEFPKLFFIDAATRNAPR